MSDTILVNGIIQGEEIPSEASQISYAGLVPANDVKEALDVVQNELDEKAATDDLASIAFTGSYADLIGAPAIPTKTSQLLNDSEYIVANTTSLNNYYTKTNTYNKEEIDEALLEIKNKYIYKIVEDIPTENISSSVIYIVPQSGNVYKEMIYLADEETWVTFSSGGNVSIAIDQIISDITKTSTNPISTKGVYDYVNSKLPTIIENVESDKNNPVTSKGIHDFVESSIDELNLADVAFSGSYSDLKDIPAGNDIGPATPSTLGLIKTDNISVYTDNDGTLHANSGGPATIDQIGLVKPDGETITIDANGVISLAIPQAEEVSF